jgi:HD-GYP domain-containing protein (c-di-GMP phosphodiesterase class II)/CHASE2 domain-containing sensor protein
MYRGGRASRGLDVNVMFGFLKKREYLHPLIIWLLLLFWYLAFAEEFFSAPQIRVDNFITEQSFWFFNQTPKEAEKVCIVAIDEASRRRLNLVWPWKRSVTAKLINEIASFSPEVIGIDIIFSGRSTEEEDKDLVSALQSHPNIVQAYALQRGSEQNPTGDLLYTTPFMGFVNKPTRGRLVDETRTFYARDGKPPLLSIEVEILLRYLGIDKSRIKADSQGILLDDRLFIPSPHGITRLNYLAHPLSLTIIPASLVLEKRVNPEDIKGKIVLVGVTDPLLHDEYFTPLGVWPGVTIIGNSMIMLLSKRLLHTPSPLQNYLLALILGLLILGVNRRFQFLQNVLLTLLFFALGYFSILYLRARGIHLTYFSLLFSGTMAFLVPNLYRYVNLLYLSTRLRNLAITDPFTGFDSARYFVLKLHEKLRSHEAFSFLALRVGNYGRLALKLDFEQTKRLSKLLSEYLRSEIGRHFRRSEFSRLSNETVAIMLGGPAKGLTESFVGELIRKAEANDWKIGEEGTKLSFKAFLLKKSKAQTGGSEELMHRMERAFESTKDGEVSVEDLGSGEKEGPRKYTDILDFIAYDWEERRKELEHALKALLEANKKLDKLNWGTLSALARAIDAQSKWTAGHSERVTKMALEIGRALGLGQDELDNINRAALLHDIGKIGLPPDFLNKPSALSDEEYSLVREHPSIGERILEPIEAFAEILPMIKQHHEWFNGKGYPDGLVGEQISLGGRILAVADVYDALSSDRPYRGSMNADVALQVIRDGSGSHFDPLVVEALAKVLQNKEAPSH